MASSNWVSSIFSLFSPSTKSAKKDTPSTQPFLPAAPSSTQIPAESSNSVVDDKLKQHEERQKQNGTHSNLHHRMHHLNNASNKTEKDDDYVNVDAEKETTPLLATALQQTPATLRERSTSQLSKVSRRSEKKGDHFDAKSVNFTNDPVEQKVAAHIRHPSKVPPIEGWIKCLNYFSKALAIFCSASNAPYAFAAISRMNVTRVGDVEWLALMNKDGGWRWGIAIICAVSSVGVNAAVGYHFIPEAILTLRKELPEKLSLAQGQWRQGNYRDAIIIVIKELAKLGLGTASAIATAKLTFEPFKDRSTILQTFGTILAASSFISTFTSRYTAIPNFINTYTQVLRQKFYPGEAEKYQAEIKQAFDHFLYYSTETTADGYEKIDTPPICCDDVKDDFVYIETAIDHEVQNYESGTLDQSTF